MRQVRQARDDAEQDDRDPQRTLAHCSHDDGHERGDSEDEEQHGHF